jgi:hypothetical protein
MIKRVLKLLIPVQIKDLINRHWNLEAHHYRNRQYSGKRLLENLSAANRNTYDSLKNYREPEHQIGRFLNMCEVAAEVEKLGIEGDIVEFGTYQGVGLSLLDKAFGKPTNRKLIGIDCFEGLPQSSTVWTKGTFGNTSVDIVRAYLDQISLNTNEYSLIKGLFDDKRVKVELNKQCKSISIVHFDADLGSSTLQALQLIEPYLVNRKEPLYFLFDDWGCHPDEVPEAFLSWSKEASSKYKFDLTKHSSTNFTRYYRLSF